MKRVIVTCLLLIVVATSGFAQKKNTEYPLDKWKREHPQSYERIRAIKVAFITDKLGLTPKQSAAFWPIYDEYEKEVRNERRAFYKKYIEDNPDETNAYEARSYIDANLDYQQKVLDIKKQYNDKFLTVISAQQVADLYRAERDFKEMLIEQWKKRHSGGSSWGSYNHNGYSSHKDQE